MRHYSYELTCGGCPEQYDIWDNDKNIKVAYARFRWGYLQVHPYKPETYEYIDTWTNEKKIDQEILWNIDIYEWECNDSLLGILPNEKRDSIIDEIDEAVYEYWNTDKENIQ